MIVAITISVLSTGCASSNAATVVPPIWARDLILSGDELKCARQLDGESFFVAQTADRVKLGARLDMSKYPLPHSFIVGWVVKNEKGEHLVTDVPPTPVRRAYVKEQARLYAEHVQYQSIYLRESKKLEIAVNIKKCLSTVCERDRVAAKEETYSVDVCEVVLR